MADIQISKLPAADLPLSGAEELPLTQGTTTKKATVAAIRSAAATDLVEYYIAPTGDDSNDGLTPATALATVRQLENLLPLTVRHPTIVHMASGTYAPPVLADRIWKSPIRFMGDGAGVLGDTARDVQVTDTVDSSANDHTVTGLTAGYVANDLVGMSIEFTTGANAGIPRTIRSNTADTFTVVWNFPSAPQVGDAYQIYQSAVIFGDATDSEGFMLAGCGDPTPIHFSSNYGDPAMAIFENMNFESASTLVAPSMVQSCLLFWGCRVTGTILPVGSRLISGTFFPATRGMLQTAAAVGITASMATDREGWCMTNGTSAVVPRAILFEGFLVTLAVSTSFVSTGMALVLKGGRAANLTASDARTTIDFSNGGGPAASQPPFLFDRRSSAGDSLVVSDGAQCRIQMAMEFADAVNTNTAIKVQDGAIITTTTVTGNGGITIAGTNVVDLHADIGGVIKYQDEDDFSGGGATTIRASNTDSTMSAIPSEGQLSVDGSSIYQRATA